MKRGYEGQKPGLHTVNYFISYCRHVGLGEGYVDFGYSGVSLLSHWSSCRFLPVAHVASKHLREAVAPEEAAQHHARLPLAPFELLRHADGTDWHGNPGAVQEAGAEQEHHCPNPRHRPARLGRGTSTD